MLKIPQAIWAASVLCFAPMCLPSPSMAEPVGASSQAPGYLLVVGKSTDRAKIAGYAAALPPIYAQHEGYYLAVGGAGRGVTWLEGPWQDRSLIFGKFPSRTGIDAFWWGDAYRSAVRKRDNAGVFSVVALTGTPSIGFEGAGTGYLIVMTGIRDASAQQVQAAQVAAQTLKDGVLASGGVLMTSTDAGQFTSLEGDTLFDRFIVAAWPTLAARDAYLASAPARRAARFRARLGISAVASANGFPRPQSPPATSASSP